MNKKIIKSIIFALCLGLYITTMATSQVTLQGEVQTVLNNTEWRIESEAPQLKVTIKDGYKRTGKTQKVVIQLDGAEWIDGNGSGIRPTEYENLKAKDIAIGRQANGDLIFTVSIPENIKRDDVISFTIPLWVKMDEGEEKDEVYVWVRPGEDSDLIQEEHILIGVKSNKKLLLEVGEVPQITNKGTISEITLKEVNQYAMGKNEVDITLKLQNENLVFGAFEYISEQKNTDDTYYVLKPEQYISYQGGFLGFDEDVRLTVPKGNDKEITFRIKGKDAAEVGSILLKNIPIINLDNQIKAQDVFITVEAEALIKSGEKILVAHLVDSIEQEVVPDDVIKDNSEEVVEENTEYQVKFRVGANYFIANNQKYEMLGTTYIQEPGYVMVPVRYVAYALGADKDQVSFKDGKVIIQYNDRTLELKVGSKQAKVNKNMISMQTALVVKEGVSYAPIGEIASLLGVDKVWDGVNKEVIFQR